MSLYPKIRSVHLCAGLVALPFLIVYAISAVQMTHGKWLPLKPHVTERAIALSPGLTDARAAARDLAARYAISGELTAIRVTPKGLAFRILRPGMVWQIDYAPTTGATTLKITGTGLLGALNRIHQMHGTWHEWSAYNLWAIILALVGAAILTLGSTGLYLWWMTHRDRRLSGALLTIAVTAIGGLAAWMRF